MPANNGSFPPKETRRAQKGKKYDKPRPHFRPRILHVLRIAFLSDARARHINTIRREP
jgi:hypothetical protein